MLLVCTLYRDALIVAIGNALTSIFSGFVIFSIVGYLAHELNKSVDAVVDQGTFFYVFCGNRLNMK